MKVELNCAWQDRPRWHGVARAMAERTRCPDHPTTEPRRVTVVIPPEGLPPLERVTWSHQPDPVSHPKPILWVDCGDERCKWFASFDRRDTVLAEVLSA